MGYRRMSPRRTVVGAAVFLVTGAATLAHATTITVNVASNATGDNKCSFDEAVKAVNRVAGQDACPVGNGSADTIVMGAGTFNATPGTVFLRSVIISGAGLGSTTLQFSASAGAVALTLNPKSPSTIKNLTIQGAAAQNQTGVMNAGTTVNLTGVRIKTFYLGLANQAGSLSMTSSTVTGNSGRGIINYAPATLTIAKSQIIANSSTGEGAGLYNFGNAVVSQSTFDGNSSSTSGGGISSTGLLDLTNSTFKGNSAQIGGGLLIDLFSPESGFVELTNTIAQNSATLSGGGIAFFGTGNSTTSSVGNCSLFTNNTAPSGPDIAGDLSSIGTAESIVSNSSGFTGMPGLWVVGDPTLGAYSSINGEPKTFSLPPTSIAVDTCPYGLTSFDQRGFPRPLDGNANGELDYDIGAFELDPWQTENLTVAAKSSDTHSVFSDAAYSNGKGSLLSANAVNDYVTYAVKVSPLGGTYSIAVRAKRANNRGKYQLATAETQNGTYTNRGGVQDLYVSGNDFVETTLGTVTFGSGGTKYIRFTVTGQNASSAGFLLSLDYLKLTKQ